MSDTDSRASSSAPVRGYRGKTLFFVALLSAGLAGASGFALRAHLASHHGGEEHAAGGVLYQCPMHPSVVQDHPGNCPICGMKLVKMAQKTAPQSAPAPQTTASAAPPEPFEPAHGLAAIEIDPARQQLIGLSTEVVQRTMLGGALRTSGRVSFDETRVRRVNVKVPGFVERVFADYVGKRVRRGDALFTFFSPELLGAEDEYLVALRSRALLGGGGTSGFSEDPLLSAAKKKLLLWDVPESELERLTQSKELKRTFTYSSPVAGVVTKKEIVEGSRLEAGATPFEIVDLSVVWVLADVYESELGRVKEGMPARLTLKAFPNREFKGKAAFIDPLLDAETRTAKVRLAFDNARAELKPEMFGEVVLEATPHSALSVPRDALIDSGTQQIVFVAEANGKFSPRAVRSGETSDGRVEIIEGLREGERVVTRANFLVDSESRLEFSLGDMAPKVEAHLDSARVLPQSKVSATPLPMPAASGSQR